MGERPRQRLSTRGWMSFKSKQSKRFKMSNVRRQKNLVTEALSKIKGLKVKNDKKEKNMPEVD